MLLEKCKDTQQRVVLLPDTDVYASVVDENQDFRQLDERSLKVGDVGFVQKEFEAYCLKEALQYLKAYKGTFPFYEYVTRLFPKWYKYFIMKYYQQDQLLFTLHSLRSEENREIAIEGLKALLKQQNQYK